MASVLSSLSLSWLLHIHAFMSSVHDRRSCVRLCTSFGGVEWRISRKISVLETTEPSILLLYFFRNSSVLEATERIIFLLYFKEDLTYRGHRAKYFSPIFQGRSQFSRPQSQVFFSYISRKISVLEDTERKIILAEDRSPIYIFSFFGIALFSMPLGEDSFSYISWKTSVLEAKERRIFLLRQYQGRSQFSRPQNEVYFSFISNKICSRAIERMIFLLYFTKYISFRSHKVKGLPPIFHGR